MELLTEFQEELRCAICLDYSEQAVETTCCKRMYCESCLTDHATDKKYAERKCPNCAVPYIAYRINDLGRRMIGRIPFICANNCGTSLKRSERQAHLTVCPKRLYECPKKDCTEVCFADQYMQHVAGQHRNEFLSNAKYLFEANKPEKPEILALCPFLACEVTDTKENLSRHVLTVHRKSMVKAEKGVLECPLCEEFSGIRADILSHLGSEHRTELCVVISDLIQTSEATSTTVNSDLPSTVNDKTVNSDLSFMVNEINSPVRFGQNGKFYCRQASVIGPADSSWLCEYPGLNCRYCMDLDCKVRDLPPEALVNAMGVVSEPKFEAIGSFQNGAILVKPHYCCGDGCTAVMPCHYCNDLTKVCARVQEYHGSADQLITVTSEDYRYDEHQDQPSYDSLSCATPSYATRSKKRRQQITRRRDLKKSREQKQRAETANENPPEDNTEQYVPETKHEKRIRREYERRANKTNSKKRKIGTEKTVTEENQTFKS